MSGLRHLRACLMCALVKPYSKWTLEGCPNCDHFLEMRGSSEAVQDCTSENFEGLITVINPEDSWVAKWQRLEGYVPGVYAVKVEGYLMEDYVSAAEASGVKYIPRDGSKVDQEEAQ